MQLSRWCHIRTRLINNGDVAVVLGMGEANCDIGIDLYRHNIYRPRALVVVFEVAPLSGGSCLPGEHSRLCV